MYNIVRYIQFASLFAIGRMACIHLDDVITLNSLVFMLEADKFLIICTGFFYVLYHSVTMILDHHAEQYT